MEAEHLKFGLALAGMYTRDSIICGRNISRNWAGWAFYPLSAECLTDFLREFDDGRYIMVVISS